MLLRTNGEMDWKPPRKSALSCEVNSGQVSQSRNRLRERKNSCLTPTTSWTSRVSKYVLVVAFIRQRMAEFEASEISVLPGF